MMELQPFVNRREALKSKTIGPKFNRRLIVAALLLVAPLSLTSCSKIANPFEKKPQLDFQPSVVELGSVEEGAEVPTFFMLKNVGNEVLKIHEAHSTCGCTVPKLKQNALQPGESTKLDIMVDTTMKQGAVTKTVEVSSNDPNMPVVSLPIKMEVKNRHEGLTDDGRIKIFTDEKCTSCHVDRGVGLVGKDLFEADCAMCHGEDARGAVGGGLIFGNYDDPKYAKHIKDTIEFGSKNHRSMPGFLDRAGGPLLQEQVDSIIVYLKKLSEDERAKSNSSKKGAAVKAVKPATVDKKESGAGTTSTASTKGTIDSDESNTDTRKQKESR